MNKINLIILTTLLITLTSNLASADLYIVSGQITNNSINLDPFYYLGSEQEYNESTQNNPTHKIQFYLNEKLQKDFEFSINTYGNFYFLINLPDFDSYKILTLNNQLILEKSITTQKPKINNMDINEDNKGFLISWNSEDNDSNSEELTYTISYLFNNSWTEIISNIKETEAFIPKSILPQGNLEFKIKASDGFNTGYGIEEINIDTETFYIGIESPDENQIFTQETQKDIILRGFLFSFTRGFITENLFWQINNNQEIQGNNVHMNESHIKTGDNTIRLYSDIVGGILEDIIKIKIPSKVKGDFNQDGVVNGLDIPKFKQALGNPEEWSKENNIDVNLIGDLNNDSAFNGLDIPGFKEALSNSVVATSTNLNETKIIKDLPEKIIKENTKNNKQEKETLEIKNKQIKQANKKEIIKLNKENIPSKKTENSLDKKDELKKSETQIEHNQNEKTFIHKIIEFLTGLLR